MSHCMNDRHEQKNEWVQTMTITHQSPDSNRWNIVGNGIEWNIRSDNHLPHEDSLEMSGLRTSLILGYGVNNRDELVVKRHGVWPSFRTIPNNTGGSFQADIEVVPQLEFSGRIVIERPVRIRFDGVWSADSYTDNGLQINRKIFPSTEHPVILERIHVRNTSAHTQTVRICNNHAQVFGRGCNGVYIVESVILPNSEKKLAPGAEGDWDLQISVRLGNESVTEYDFIQEFQKRQQRIAELTDVMQLETGIPEVDKAFYFSKLRAGESIFQTRGGLMHSPGGGTYYAATWCNDQVEYAGPWFAFTADPIAMEASLTAYRQYMPFMGPRYTPIPSSVVAEGADIWEGRGDRGDAAMYAYGASHFALISGNRDIASELWPAIRWCLEYCRRKMNQHGVIESDTDELEGRLPAGSANLCTSSLYYGGLRAAAYLAREFNDERSCLEYTSQADVLARAIESFFSAELHGFKTYLYYEGNTNLRSWISIPLCMGLFDRAHDTVRAMFSPYLWTGNGMISQEADTVFWDRSTLYGLRGTFMAGETDIAWQKLREYSRCRLLGEHVPYPVEAWPEGNQRHLAAESALYCRVIAEGLLGISATGLQSFKLTPRLPQDLKTMALRNVNAFGTQFNIVVEQAQIYINEMNGHERCVKSDDFITFV